LPSPDTSDDWIQGLSRSLELWSIEARLVETAERALEENWEPEDLGGGIFLLWTDVTALFRQCFLQFRWNTAALVAQYPFISTRFMLFVGDIEVGYYSLITFPSGQVDDSYLVISEEFWAGERRNQELVDTVVRLRSG
jgi:hypothetical protein